MFDGFETFRIPDERPEPERPRRTVLTKRQERTFLLVIGVNLLLLFVAPIGGATLFAAIRAAFF
ncbi:hypothetical protein LX81_03244 [Palleronia aestuarii]|uniref:Uncharacterized protein n=1 Tax=Palleronia aestuarii TaxID=568105 RepID=A0A2W7N064_9RHOB|nr:hypothetical protein [Palleronia aestuarii]PZX13460.1 hypothetical protein LX81_03244 [Palleronia aestuarii]